LQSVSLIKELRTHSGHARGSYRIPPKTRIPGKFRVWRGKS